MDAIGEHHVKWSKFGSKRQGHMFSFICGRQIQKIDI
jgi:hypothetical protein